MQEQQIVVGHTDNPDAQLVGYLCEQGEPVPVYVVSVQVLAPDLNKIAGDNSGDLGIF